jgi:Membrane protein involved in the export of O-antigen and teichoic acid
MISRSVMSENIQWNVTGSMAGKLLGPILQVVIARFLMPEDYGVFALALTFVYLHGIFKDLGITESIIANPSKLDMVGVQFSLQLIIGSLSFILTLLCAPMIGALFNVKDLEVALSIMTIVFLIDPFIDPYVTHWLKTQNYFLVAVRQIVIPIISGLLGIALAVSNFGFYSLVFSYLAGQLVLALYVVYKEGIPSFVFDLKRVKQLLVLGKHVIVQRLSGFLTHEADLFVIGSAFGSDKLGFYKMGRQLAFLVPNSVLPSVSQVLFTEFSANRQKHAYVEKIYYKYVTWTGVLTTFFSLACFTMAPIVVRMILGVQWEFVGHTVVLLSGSVITGFICYPNNDFAKVLGFSHKYSVFGLLRSIFSISAVAVAGLFYGFEYAFVAWVLVSYCANAINDLIFHTSQSVVPFKKVKLFFTG